MTCDRGEQIALDGVEEHDADTFALDIDLPFAEQNKMIVGALWSVTWISNENSYEH